MDEVTGFSDLRLASLRLPSYPISGCAGASFKHEHLQAILTHDKQECFFEVHAENYMGAGGAPHYALERIRRDFPLSVHGVSMSIGGHQPLNRVHLKRFRTLIERYEPALVSEHLAWSTHENTYFNDLLPLPYTQATLSRISDHIDEMQEHIGRTILLENPSTYVMFSESTMTETAFIRELACRTGCGLLLDVNNVFVSANNFGFSAHEYLADFPFDQVGEVHLAGHSDQVDDEGDILLVDSHDKPVSEAVWQLFEMVVARRGPVPTLVEWDSDVPEWAVLSAEVAAAQNVLNTYETKFVSGEIHARLRGR